MDRTLYLTSVQLGPAIHYYWRHSIWRQKLENTISSSYKYISSLTVAWSMKIYTENLHSTAILIKKSLQHFDMYSQSYRDLLFVILWKKYIWRHNLRKVVPHCHFYIFSKPKDDGNKFSLHIFRDMNSLFVKTVFQCDNLSWNGKCALLRPNFWLNIWRRIL